MSGTTIEVTVNDVTAVHDRSGDIKYVDITLTYHSERQFDKSREATSVFAVEYRFGVTEDRIAELWQINRTKHTDSGSKTSLSDLQALPAAIEILDGFDGIDGVHKVEETVDKIVSLADSVEYKDEE